MTITAKIGISSILVFVVLALGNYAYAGLVSGNYSDAFERTYFQEVALFAL